MTFVIDTHIFLWLIFDPDKISKEKITILEDPANKILIASISFFEISLKYNLKKLDLHGIIPENLPDIAKKMDILPANIDSKIMASFYKLEKIDKHNDPFDRLLIWYCICKGYTLISQDRKFRKYKKLGLISI